MTQRRATALPHADMPAQAGFSLIEVVVTLVILALLTTVVTTNLRGVTLRQAVKAERGQLASMIEDLRTISLYANRDISVRTYLQTAQTNDVEDAFYLGLPNLTEETWKRRLHFSAALDLPDDVLISSPGACSSGQGSLTLSNGDVLPVSIAALTCEVRFG